jgi:hypothetical protein
VGSFRRSGKSIDMALLQKGRKPKIFANFRS